MPSRPITFVIVLFWLATTGWLVYREVAPLFRAGEPPRYTIDLTDEVGHAVDWKVKQKGEVIGTGLTRVQRREDRSFVLHGEFRLERFRLFGTELPKLKIVHAHRVTEEGTLLGVSANFKCDLGVALEIDFEGEVRDDHLHPRLQVLLAGKDLNPFGPLEPMAVSESGAVLNPTHLVHKIAGLRAGQSWKIPVMDPLQALPAQVRELAPGKSSVLDHVVAEVREDSLLWRGGQVPCFKIEYLKPGEAVLAATWVRRRDGVVLQQWASYEGIDFAFERVQE